MAKCGERFRPKPRKVHLGIHADTLEIWAIEIIGSRSGLAHAGGARPWTDPGGARSGATDKG
jgi:hypothetical protein